MRTHKGLVTTGNSGAKSWVLLVTLLALPALQGCVGLTSSGPNKPSGTEPVTIDPPAAVNITSSSATITWVTTVAASSQVDYGTTSAYGSQTALDTTMVVSHSQTLNGLKASTSYHYRVLSTDVNNNLATSGDLTFTTSATADTTPPTVSITAPASGATVSGTVSVTANASDNVAVASVQFRVDGSNVGSAVTAAPYSYSLNSTALSNGSHTLTAVAADTSNNTATSAGVTITVNNVTPPPTISITAPVSGATVSGTVSVTANASSSIGVASVQFQLDGANVGSLVTTAPYAYSWNTATAANGSHTLRAIAKDTAGNSTTSASVTVTVNNVTQPPTVSITAPASGATLSGTVSVTANASSSIGVASVQFQLDSANVGSPVMTAPYSYSWNTATAANGSHTLRAIAKDTAGNSITSAAVSVTVSNAAPPPTVSISMPASGATVSGTVSVTANASSSIGVASVQFQLDSANVGSLVTTAPYSYSWNTATAANGSHTLRAIAKDTAGNSTTSASVTVTVNNVTPPPTVSITAPASGATVSGTVSVTANASSSIGVASVQFQLDSANVGSLVTTAPYSYSWNTATAANGSHTLRAIAKDTAGNSTTSAAVSVTVSNAAPPPTVSITAPASGATVSGAVSVMANASSSIGVASVQFQLDSANVGSLVTTAPYSYSWNTTTAANGSHTLVAIAKDTAGNSTTSASVTVTVSNAAPPPTVSITAPASGATVSGTISVTANASSSIGVASVQFQVDSSNVGSAVTAAPYSYSLDTTTLANGSHTLTAIAKDTAGTSTTSPGVSVTVSNVVNTSMGPLVHSSSNAHYFVNPAGRGVLLAGSQSWDDEQDTDLSTSPAALDFTGYVNFLKSHGHSVTILWHKDLPTYCNWGPGGTWTMGPFPWQRTGAGNASDGKPQFDLTQFNQAYFDRLLARVSQLQQNGIYAIVQLFDGLGLTNNRCAVDGYPFTGGNNVNGVDDGGGTNSMTMSGPNTITGYQDAYVQKVIDTLNGQPNVLWEISEEAPDNSTWWQGHMISLIRSYEGGKAWQHPIGFPSLNVSGTSDSTLYNSNADWVAPMARISPTSSCGTGTPACKVNINDTDHSYYGMWNDTAQVNRNFIWENFSNGDSVMFMDPYLIDWPSSNRNLCSNPVNGVCSGVDTRWNNFRDNMGYIASYANTKLDLVKMTPQGNLSSTGYCLADNVAAGAEYLVYAPNGGSFTVNLSATTHVLNVEWFNPSTGTTSSAGLVTGGTTVSFTPPFSGDAVLYLVDAAGHN